MNVASPAATVPAVDPSSAGTVIVAAKAIAQTRLEGRHALELIQSAAAPPTGDHRGQLVNTMA